MKLARRILRFIGVVCIAFAIIGLLFLSVPSLFMFSNMPEDPEKPYVLQAFTIMLLINVVCYCALFFLGVQFIRLKSRLFPFLAVVVVFEVIYFFSIGFLWLFPDREIARSVAAATGIANGGLMPQFLTLFPIWGPLLAFWADKEFKSHLPYEEPDMQMESSPPPSTD